MFRLFRKKRTPGGLYFGPAGWIPEHWHVAGQAPARLLVMLPESWVPRPGFPKSPVVRQGGLIAPGQTDDEADVLAPLTGRLGGIQEVHHEATVRAAIELLVDPTVDPPITSRYAPDQDQEPTLKALQNVLRLAGIGQLSAHVPALLTQLVALDNARPVRTILVNMLPSQPESRLPYALAHLELPLMLKGLELVRQHIPARRTIVAVDRHDWSGTRRWRKALRKTGVRVRGLLNKYPQGHPTLLVRRLLGKRLAVDALPTTLGIVMLDPVTLWALGRFAATGRGVTDRPVELFSSTDVPHIAMAPLGLPLTDLLTAHGLPTEHQQCIVNGMLAGMEVDPARTVMATTTISVAVRPMPLVEAPSPCIQCGWCLDHCPTELNPIALHNIARSAGTRHAASQEALYCVGCGLCSYVCPTRLPLAPEVIALRAAARRELRDRIPPIHPAPAPLPQGGADA